MWRCAQPLCVRCLLSKVKVLRFNYQKMLAVGSVPLEDRQGQGCGCPPSHRGRWTSAPPREPLSLRLGMAARLPTCTSVGRARETRSYGSFIRRRWGALSPALSPHQPPCAGSGIPVVVLWWMDIGSRTGRRELVVFWGKMFTPVTSLNRVTGALDTWERCRSCRAVRAGHP